jgi:hypothetical protein
MLSFCLIWNILSQPVVPSVAAMALFTCNMDNSKVKLSLCLSFFSPSVSICTYVSVSLFLSLCWFFVSPSVSLSLCLYVDFSTLDLSLSIRMSLSLYVGFSSLYLSVCLCQSLYLCYQRFYRLPLSYFLFSILVFVQYLFINIFLSLFVFISLPRAFFLDSLFCDGKQISQKIDYFTDNRCH